jgi:hypothetical protein
VSSIVLTAGFDRSPHVLALAELLVRDGMKPIGVLVARAGTLERARRELRSSGWSGLARSARRFAGMAPRGTGGNEMADLLEELRVGTSSLERWASSNGVAYRRVGSLNDADAVGVVRQLAPDVIAYGGGGILRESFLQAAPGPILNAHQGPLPAIRGMNAVEWSLLLGEPPTVTVHFIDAGIDTGATVSATRIPLRAGDTLDSLRQRGLAIGVRALHQALTERELSPQPSVGAPGRQCFTMAPALRALAETRLAAALPRR